jgi:hypothetical protein
MFLVREPFEPRRPGAQPTPFTFAAEETMKPNQARQAAGRQMAIRDATPATIAQYTAPRGQPQKPRRPDADSLDGLGGIPGFAGMGNAPGGAQMPRPTSARAGGAPPPSIFGRPASAARSKAKVTREDAFPTDSSVDVIDPEARGGAPSSFSSSQPRGRGQAPSSFHNALPDPAVALHPGRGNQASALTSSLSSLHNALPPSQPAMASKVGGSQPYYRSSAALQQPPSFHAAFNAMPSAGSHSGMRRNGQSSFVLG